MTERRRGCRYWCNLLLVGAAGLLAATLLVAYVALPLIHADSVAHPARVPLCCTTPSDAGFEYEDVSFQAADGTLLRGWYLPSQNGAAVAIAHGAGGNRVGHLAQGAALARHGYGVLLFDLRAHGESEGDTATFGGADLAAAARYLATRNDVDPGKIGAWGFSLGGLVAIQATAETDLIAAVVADGAGPGVFRDEPAPASLVDALWVPFDWVWFQSLSRAGVTAPTATIDLLPRLASLPILFVSGAGQDYERRAMRKYYAAAAGPATLWEIPEARHLGGWKARPDEYEARVVDFFDRALLDDD